MAGTFHDWEVPPGDQPAPDGFAYDLDLALTSVVAVTVLVALSRTHFFAFKRPLARSASTTDTSRPIRVDFHTRVAARENRA